MAEVSALFWPVIAFLLGTLQKEEKLEREALRQEWVRAQEKIKGNLNLTKLWPLTTVYTHSNKCSMCVDSLLMVRLCPCLDEEIQITYSYWDGSGHRKRVKVCNGHWLLVHLIQCRYHNQLHVSFLQHACNCHSQLDSICLCCHFYFNVLTPNMFCLLLV